MYTHEKHTPIDGDYWIIRKDGLLFAKTFSAHDTRRIVALGNACEGIPVEVLSAPDYSIKAELDTLDEQIARRLNAEEERNRLYALRIKNEEELHSLRFRLAAIEQAATDVEAYIDGERLAVPDVYMERLRDELIRAREALGILPEQDAVRPKESHDAQHPGQLFDLDEIKKGQSRSKVEINASNVQLLGGGQGHSEAGNSSAGSSENPYRRRSESAGSAPAADPQQDFPDDIHF